MESSDFKTEGSSKFLIMKLELKVNFICKKNDIESLYLNVDCSTKNLQHPKRNFSPQGGGTRSWAAAAVPPYQSTSG